MELKRLKAVFGRLNGEELELHPGLNIIEAPNEAGKSTWAAFLRAMFYGVSTSERGKNGSIPDKKHYQPWSGAPMSGTVELRWQEQDITLRRSSPNPTRPMAEVNAVYTGTGEAVPELKKDVPGNVLLGVTEPVYRRSAFISGASLAVDADPDLEKRITRLVTTGEERSSYTEADDRLRRWQRKRRWRNSGALPEAEAQKQALREKLVRIELENKRLSGLREDQEKYGQQIDLLKRELQLHKRDERKAELARQAAAEQAYQDAVAESAEADARLQALREQVGNLNSAAVTAVREASVRWQEAEHDRRDAEAAFHEKDSACAALPDPQPEPNPKKTPMLILFILGVIALLGGFAVGMALLPLPVGAAIGLIAAGLILLLVACLLLASGRKQVREKLAAETQAKELAKQAKDSAEAQLRACTEETDGCRAALTEAPAVLGEGPDADPAAAADRAESLLRELRDAVIIADNAKKLAERLEVSPAAPMEPIPEDELEGETRLGKAAAEDYLLRTEERLRSTNRDLNRGEGLFDLLGDPLVLATEEARLDETARRLQEEYDALELAADAMRQANARLQTLFSPLISRRAAALMGRMTDSAYTGVYFDREMRFSAQRGGEGDVHALEYLSDGTRSQLYLSVRLAITDLLLSGEEPAPLILDDVLLSYDDQRARDTLRLLRELSKDRQILLFTCQSREQRLLNELEAEECQLQ